MQCEDIKDLLSAYIDNELSKDEVRLVEAHLFTCAGCAAELDRLRAAITRVAGLARPEMSEAAAARLAAAVNASLAAGQVSHRREETKSRWRWLAGPAFLSAAAAVGAVAVAVVVWQGAAPNADLRMERAPTMQAVPPSGVVEKNLSGAPRHGGAPGESLGNNKSVAAPVFTREQIDELAQASGAPSDGREKTAGTFGKDATADKAGAQIDAAASAAASNRPAALISAVQGRFQGRLVWVVVVELSDGGQRIAAAVAVDDGRVLYRTR